MAYDYNWSKDEVMALSIGLERCLIIKATDKSCFSLLLPAKLDICWCALLKSGYRGFYYSYINRDIVAGAPEAVIKLKLRLLYLAQFSVPDSLVNRWVWKNSVEGQTLKIKPLYRDAFKAYVGDSVNEAITIKIFIPYSARQLSIKINPSCTGEELHDIIHEMTGIELYEMRLRFDGHRVTSTDTLRSIEMTDGDHLQINYPQE